jgi:hypothetical protein
MIQVYVPLRAVSHDGKPSGDFCTEHELKYGETYKSTMPLIIPNHLRSIIMEATCVHYDTQIWLVCNLSSRRNEKGEIEPYARFDGSLDIRGG